MTEDFMERLIMDNPVSIATWLTLGDGNIALKGRQVNAFFQLTHRYENGDYVLMKKNLLEQITHVSVALRNRSYGQEWQLWTGCHPMFNKVRLNTYLNGHKVIYTHSIKLMTPLCLALLYQDDGRYSPEKSTISINKPTFSKTELEMLAKGIVDRFGIIFRVRRSCTLKDGSIGHELGLRYSDKDKFFSMIDPYIVPSMFYKVGKGGTSSEVVI